jgi:hypothetical protein
MTQDGVAILACLQAVAQERLERSRTFGLAESVVAVKRFQHLRFEHTYADMLTHPRYAAAAGFFLDDLYGPHDFTERDAQFSRIVPAMQRLLPAEVIGTVLALARLHALSESLDSEMGKALIGHDLRAVTYARAWQTVGRRLHRLEQIDLMRSVGDALDGFTRVSGLRQLLKFMRIPARAAGLQALQAFLERGFDTFRSMRGADYFLDQVVLRERALAEQLFSGVPDSLPSDFAFAEHVMLGLGETP